MNVLRKLGKSLDRLNFAQRVALTFGSVVAIVLLAALFAPPVYPSGGWFGYSPNAFVTDQERPVLFSRIDNYRPWLSTLWWLGTDGVATAVAVGILRTPPDTPEQPPA